MKQGKLSLRQSFIGLKDADFNSRYLSNAKHLFSETLSQNITFKYVLTKCYHNTVLFLLTATPPYINADINIGEQIFYPLSSNRKGFSKKIRFLFGVAYRTIRDVGMKRWALNFNGGFSL